MGRLSGGRWLEILVAIDAFGVLAGAVLTAYVGINGLFQRLAIDRVLPSFLLKVNSCRGTNHFIILVFFIVASSLVFILNAEVTVLSGVFALAFLCVLLSFIIACVLLKLGREEIPRKRTTSWINTTFCLCTISLGILANAFSDVKALLYFFIYFAVFFLVVFLMLARVSLLKALLFVSGKLLAYFQGDTAPTQQLSERGQAFAGSVMIAKTIETIKNTPVVFFCKAANLPKINEAVSYVMRNEHTYCLRLVHVCEPNAPVPREFEHVVNLFDHIYPSIKIDFVAVTGAFDPAMVQWLSKSMDVPTNMMFMRQPANENKVECAQHEILWAYDRISAKTLEMHISACYPTVKTLKLNFPPVSSKCRVDMRLILSVLLVLGILNKVVEATNDGKLAPSVDAKVVEQRFLRAYTSEEEERVPVLSSLAKLLKNQEVAKAEKLIAEKASFNKLLSNQVDPKHLRKALGFSKDFDYARFMGLSREKKQTLMAIINQSDEMGSKYQMLRQYETIWKRNHSS
ncbi:Amino Acid-Polyamine-Organocation (APC) protein [Phytophthora megakarya]|uniref:Amino Acid-Polyamine-Organocation (APC) protein n=1 Tax=Phytophthora megakarya TaxID=4795 RepID=A0A225W3B1_9STRA|nr:Amino Acid-Polyamine-Organocation (APC) protein [Phytophthora megakarya]